MIKELAVTKLEENRRVLGRSEEGDSKREISTSLGTMERTRDGQKNALCSSGQRSITLSEKGE